MVQKRIPMRQCVGCGTSKPKKQLIRVVHNAAGEISIDATGKKPGRGAYLCPDEECLSKAFKKKALERAFDCTISEEVLAQLKEQLSAIAGEAQEG